MLAAATLVHPHGTFYTPERADELMHEYNEVLGEELDLHGARTRPRAWARPVLSSGAVGVVGAF